MAKAIVVRDSDGEVVARISPDAENVKARLNAALTSGGSVAVEDDPDFIDLIGMGAR